MKKIALLLLALVLVFPVFAADNRVDFSMGYGGTFLYSTEVKSDPMEIQKLDFTKTKQGSCCLSRRQRNCVFAISAKERKELKQAGILSFSMCYIVK